MPATSYSRIFSWLMTALKIDQPVLPQQFETGQVQGVIDVLQKGWSIALFEEMSLAIGANAAGAVVDVFTNDANECSIIIHARLAHNGGAAALYTTGRVLPRATSTLAPKAWSYSPAVGEDVGANVLLGAANAFIYVPPEWRYAFEHAATGPGETLNHLGIRVRLPRGVPPF